MDLTMEIICYDFKQLKINNNEILTDTKGEEYYIIPISKSFSVESDDDVMKLTFKNQLLWLKYSNRFKKIHLKEFNYKECVLIKSEDVLDIYLKIICDNYFRKNVWQTNTSVYMNKKCLNKYYLIFPIIEDMVKIYEYGEGIPICNIELITNEVLLKRVKKNGNHGCLAITTNFLTNKDALFIRIDDDDFSKFFDE